MTTNYLVILIMSISMILILGSCSVKSENENFLAISFKPKSDFKLSEKKALSIAMQTYKQLKNTKNSVPSPANPYTLIIGDWYVFSICTKAYIPVSGIYVNGYSGDVRIIRGNKKVPLGTKKIKEPSELRESGVTKIKKLH